MKENRLNKKTWGYFSLVGMIIFGMLFTACSDDDDAAGGGPITVDAVYLQDVDSDVPDREVTFARLGQLLRLEGSGFTGVRRVYINGFQSSFNPVFVSDNSMLVRVSADTPTIEAEEDVRNTIRLEKDNSETVIEFEIRSSAPSIDRVSHTLPKPGEEITVYGSGLIEVSSVVFPGDVVVTEGITYDEEDGEFFTVTVPEGVSEEGGSLYIQSANGAAYSPAFFHVERGVILNFDGMGEIGEFGNTIRQGQLQSEPIGEGNVSQGNYLPIRNDSIEAFGAGKNRVAEVFTSGNESWRSQLTPFIPATTPLEEVAFQFDIYVPEPWVGSGYLKILLINNFNGGEWSGGVYNYVPWIVDGEVEPFETEGWTTVTIPFTEFYLFSDDEDYTFEDLLQYRESATYKNFGMFFENSDFTLGQVTGSNSEEEFLSSDTSVQVYTDNWRIVPLETPTVTDFPE
ncbi:glycan-binding surface protein [Salegentibacter sp. F188]|uniref:Glycan-binding surface protein n=1 Tax=Autumnicola patrickiae TaxID=3075591 RepID=A0ABU3E311_9FLAO|nr:glycan-binding surface protein [Salegentibacter sp. F188]MDT0690379.1 glycan-binding surface protein [Salegentibacter sp. F188]